MPDSKLNGNNKSTAEVLAGSEKTYHARNFPVQSLDDVLTEIRRAGGTGKLEINFKNGQARGEAKWRGFSRVTS